jgi:hypothetical protein
MRKLHLAIAAAATALSIPAAAITGTEWVRDTEHPFVGLIVFYDAQGQFTHRCSGSLLSPTKFLTAGHCTAPSTGAVTARIYFQQNAGANFDPATGVDPVSGYPETCAPGTLGIICSTSTRLYNFGFSDFAGFPNTRDVGLVILTEPIKLSEYGVLADPGALDNIGHGRKNTLFTVSGYGLTKSANERSAVPNISYRERLMAVSSLTNLNSHLTDGFNLQTQGNGNGRGGTCSGDSGGPVFLGGYTSNTIVAVTSFGLNALCRGVDFSYRIDRHEVLSWINSIN